MSVTTMTSLRILRTPEPLPGQIRVGYYGRLSIAHSQIERTLDRQYEDAKELADERDWVIVDFYEDKGKSASKRNVFRPDFQRLIEDLESGHIDGVVMYALDRLLRQPVQMEALIELYEDCEAIGRKLYFATTEGDLRLDTPSGRDYARGAVNAAKYESEKISARVTREHRQRAKLGRASGRNGFGYKPGKQEVDAAEANEIRIAIEQVLSHGALIPNIVRDWNARNIKTRTGGTWTVQTVRDLLTNPRLAGFRTHKGELVYDGETPIRFIDTPIIDDLTHEQIKAKLGGSEYERYSIYTQKGQATRKRGKRPQEGRLKRYLLSGLMRCGVCRKPLVGKYDNTRKYHSYACPSPTVGGCGKISVNGPLADREIVRLLLLRNSAKPAQLRAPFAREDELREVNEEITELSTQLLNRQGRARIIMPILDGLDERREALEAERREWEAGQVTIHETNVDLEDLFNDIDDPNRATERIGAQRNAIAKVVAYVLVLPTPRVGGVGSKWNPDRLQLVTHADVHAKRS